MQLVWQDPLPLRLKGKGRRLAFTVYSVLYAMLASPFGQMVSPVVLFVLPCSSHVSVVRHTVSSLSRQASTSYLSQPPCGWLVGSVG